MPHSHVTHLSPKLPISCAPNSLSGIQPDSALGTRPITFRPRDHLKQVSPEEIDDAQKEELNAPKPRHASLLKGALNSEIPNERKSELWAPLAPQGWKPCILLASIIGRPVKSSGFIQVFLDEGLNQQRIGICDDVAIKILNATLVIPHLEVNSVWKDSSSFEEIYDVDHAINVLKDEISIVREFPPEHAWSMRVYYVVAIRITRIKNAPVHTLANWYLENVLQSYGIVAVASFSHRLAFDKMAGDLHRLCCKVNFQALAFIPHINTLGEMLVKCLRNPRHVRPDEYIQEVVHENVSNEGNRKYVTLHLRFDNDMIAHSACDFGGEFWALGGGSVELRALGGCQVEQRTSGGGPAEVQASSGGPAELRTSGSGPAELRPSGSGLAELRTSSGGPAELRRQAVVRQWSRRSKETRAISDLSLFSLGLGALSKRRGGSIYRFLVVACPVNMRKMKGSWGVDLFEMAEVFYKVDCRGGTLYK
ncbi:hypothetical protein IEQ34_012780 [Dendrobium chrysotoxum]|uniref:O-fucosyltransferase family protein n=1 Tax=Dendrobium chrysotoxum TaxID=161865 RepID=A0AAV7GMQ9_DENCH|nr:hypothetical protein IEQ34_012780 [Dendrobium chrysotoxum]